MASILHTTCKNKLHFVYYGSSIETSHPSFNNAARDASTPGYNHSESAYNTPCRVHSHTDNTVVSKCASLSAYHSVYIGV